MVASEKVFQSLANFSERSANRIQRLQAKQFASLYGGNGKLKPLGANAAIPSRSRVTRSKRSIGEPTESAQGLLSRLGDPDLTEEQFRESVKALHEVIQEYANRRGILLYDGGATNPTDDPNDLVNEGENRAYQLYDQQLIYTGSRTRSGALWVHQPAILDDDDQVVSEDEFIQVQGTVEIGGDIPVPIQGQIYSLRSRASYRLKVISFYLEEEGSAGNFVTTDAATTATSGSATMTWNSGINSIIEVGDKFTMTATATDNTKIEFTVGLERA